MISGMDWLIQTKSTHRRAQFLAWMLIIIFLLLVAVLFFVLVLHTDTYRLYSAIVFGLIVIIMFAYYLNRSGYYYWAAGLILVSSLAGPGGSLVFDPGVRQGDFVPLVYGALVVYLSGLLLPPLLTVLIAAFEWVVIIFVVRSGFFAASFNWPSFLIFVFSSATISIFSSILTHRDIKELEVRQMVAEEARRFSDIIINNLRSPLISLDQDFRVVTVNRSFYDFFKTKPEETVGQLIYHLGNGQWEIPKLRNLLDTILPEKPIINSYEIEHEFATIGRRTMLVNARHITQDVSRRQIILLSIEDITERQQAQERAFEIALERERMSFLTKFIDEASHEFRTPLALMQTDLYFLNCLEDPAKRQIKLTQIGDHIKGISRLVDLLAEVTRLEGEGAFTTQPLDVNSLVAAVVHGMPDPATRGLTLHLAKASDLPLVLAQEIWLSRALSELLDNAVRFTPPGGSVSVRTVADGEGVTVTVQDTGPGIPPEVLPYIFERFYRQDAAHTTPGFGLGLPLAQAIIERHGGRIWVDSTLGEGSTFGFTLQTAYA